MIATVALIAWALPAGAQDLEEAHRALEACVRAAEAGDAAAAKPEADRAEGLFREALDTLPDSPAPRVGLARTLSQCRIPFAPLMEQGALVGRSNALLEEALEIDPSHWTARFMLAANHYHTPEFLGRTKDSIHHFELLVEQQAGRADEPRFATPYAMLGDLYTRTGRADEARAIWEAGAALFPDHEGLARRLGKPADGDGAADRPEAPAGGDRSAGPAPGEADASPAPDGLADGDTVAMEPMVVSVDSGWAVDDARPSATLRKVDVYTAPGGTADILTVFQMLPGVTRASEGTDLYVRGGSPAETPVFLEGARLIYPGAFESLHGGAFGLLDPSVLGKAYFSSGGFSARWGDALSGVVSLDTDGRPSIPTWRAGWNFAGGGATVRRPLGPDAGVWSTVRATETSLLLALHGQEEKYTGTPRAIEASAGAVWTPRPGIALKVVALAQGDGAARVVEAGGWEGPFESRGRTTIGVLSAEVVPDDATRSVRASLGVSRRSSAFEFGALDRERVDGSVHLRIEAERAPTTGRAVRAGFEARRLDARESGRVPATESLDPGAPTEPLAGVDEGAWHAGGWVEAEIRPLEPLAVVAGARLDRLPGESGATVDPRLAVAWRSGDWTWRAGTGVFHQGRWRVRYDVPDGGSPSGLPRRARHLAGGVERQGEPFVKIETYVKRYDDYVPDGDGPAVDAATATGLDALVRWTGTERWDGWLSYSALRGRAELADGRTVSTDYDVTHSLTAVGNVNEGPWRIGVTARYGTGRPLTPVLGGRPDPDGGFPAPVYGEPNVDRLPDYFRLDARVTRFFRLGSGYLVAYAEMLNLTDRANTSDLVYDADWTNPRPVASFFADRTIVIGFEIMP